MRRREFITLAGAAVTLSFAALAQEQGRTYRLGVLVPDCRDTPAKIALFDGVKRRGFVEGVNFARECREFGGNSEAASENAADLVKSKVDVILCPRRYCNSSCPGGDINNTDPREYRRHSRGRSSKIVGPP